MVCTLRTVTTSFVDIQEHLPAEAQLRWDTHQYKDTGQPGIWILTEALRTFRDW